MSSKGIAAALTSMAIVFGSHAAFAQDVNAGGTVSTTASAPTLTTAPAPSYGQVHVVSEDSATDHDRVVRHFAIGYLGMSTIPFPTGNGAAGSVQAPVIGGRYWLTPLLGIDAGLGLGITGGSVKTPSNGGTATSDAPGLFALMIHGGVPLALVAGKHYTFEVIPEANIGFASNTVKNTGVADISNSGFRLDVGARAGAEIHFGFIGIPQLALQGSIGLYVSHTSETSTQGGSDTGTSATSLASSIQSSPWALFTNNIAALYYF